MSSSLTLIIFQLLSTEGHALLEKYQFYILPIINPDGYEYSYTRVCLPQLFSVLNVSIATRLLYVKLFTEPLLAQEPKER